MQKTINLILFFLCFTLVSCSKPLSRNENHNLVVPRLFQENMVLQRDQLINIWGKALPSSTVKIKIQGKTYSVKSNKLGGWLKKIGPLKAGGPYRLSIKNKSEEVNIENIYVGEVFLASGQSNMNWSIAVTHDYADYYNKVGSYPGIFFFKNNHPPLDTKLYDFPKEFIWQEVGKDNLSTFSSVAYSFARKMKDTLQVPIGIVQAAKDSSRIEFFMSAESLKANNEFLDELARVAQKDSPKNYFSAINFQIPLEWKNQALELRLSDTILNNTVWINDYTKIFRKDPKSLIYNIKAFDFKTNSNILSRIKDTYATKDEIKRFLRGLNSSSIYLKNSPEKQIKLRASWQNYTNFSHEFPTLVFNSLINPLFPFSFKSVLWYQGESNTHEPEHYKKLFPIMVEDWRKSFINNELPFFTMQLHPYKETLETAQLAKFRLLQQELADNLDNVYMTTAIDLGDRANIHPLRKKHVGERLANLVLDKLYDVQTRGEAPSYKKHEIIDDQIIISFDKIGNKLHLKNPSPSYLEVSSDGNKFTRLPIKLDENQIIIKNTGIKYIRYAYAENPVMNIYNSAGLPLLPFEIEV